MKSELQGCQAPELVASAESIQYNYSCAADTHAASTGNSPSNGYHTGKCLQHIVCEISFCNTSQSSGASSEAPSPSPKLRI
jgi:hypothetical protein